MMAIPSMDEVRRRDGVLRMIVSGYEGDGEPPVKWLNAVLAGRGEAFRVEREGSAYTVHGPE